MAEIPLLTTALQKSVSSLCAHEHSIIGWVYDPFRSDLTVELIANERVVATAIADLPLTPADLIQTGPTPKQGCGFRFQLPLSLMDGHHHTLTLNVREWRLPTDPKCKPLSYRFSSLSGEVALHEGRYTGWIFFSTPRTTIPPVFVYPSPYASPLLELTPVADTSSLSEGRALKAFFSLPMDTLPPKPVFKCENIPLKIVHKTVESKIVGHVESITSEEIRGFVIDLLDPSRPLDIHLFVDGTPVQLIRPNEKRTSIAKHLKIDPLEMGINGFRIPLPEIFEDGNPHRISLICRETGKVLSDGEQTLHFPKAGIPIEEFFPSTPRVDPTSPPQMTPKVSVVILNRNGEAILPELFESWQRYNSVASELIIIDHASSDTSLSIIREWEKRLPIRTLSLDYNDSFSASCNRGAAIAQGEYLLFLNNDIIWHQDALPSMIHSLEENPSVGFVGIKLIKQDEGWVSDTQHLGIRFKLMGNQYWPYELTPDISEKEAEYSPHIVPAVTGAVMLCRKNDFDTIGGFDENYFYGFEDVEISLRMAALLEKNSLCRNDLSALHKHGYTRLSGREKSVFNRLHHNAEVMSAQLGLWLKHTYRQKLYHGDTQWHSTGVKIGIVLSDYLTHGEQSRKNELLPLLKTLHTELPTASISLITPDQEWYASGSFHLLIVTTPHYDLRLILNGRSDMCSVALCDETYPPELWHHQPWWDHFDRYAFRSFKKKAPVSTAQGYPLVPVNDHTVTPFMETLAAQIRISILVPVLKEDANPVNGWWKSALQLCRYLKTAGFSAQPLWHEAWESTEHIADLSIYLYCGPTSIPLPPLRSDTLNLLWLCDLPSGIGEGALKQYDYIFSASESYAEYLHTRELPAGFCNIPFVETTRAQSDDSTCRIIVKPSAARLDYPPVCFPGVHYLLLGELYPPLALLPNVVEIAIHHDDAEDGFSPWISSWAKAQGCRVLIGTYRTFSEAAHEPIEFRQYLPPRTPRSDDIAAILTKLLENRLGHTFHTS